MAAWYPDLLFSQAVQPLLPCPALEAGQSSTLLFVIQHLPDRLQPVIFHDVVGNFSHSSPQTELIHATVSVVHA